MIAGGRQSREGGFYAVCGQKQGLNAAAVVSYVLTKYQTKFAISIGICTGNCKIYVDYASYK